MANLNKLLVHVPSSLCSDFRNKYIKGTDKSYDNKVVFLEDTKEIFTKGEIYGINVEDFNALKELVGTIPSEGGTTSTNIVDYINEKINNANHIHSVSAKSGENLIAVDTNDKVVAVSSTQALTTAVSKANSALQTITVLGKKLYNVSGTDITVEEAKSYLGLGTDYKDMTYIGSYVYNRLPEVKAKDGSIIKVTPTTDSNGKKTYTISTSAEVFHYKGNKTKITELPSTGNKTGDVWSVGPTNATGSTLYAWDGDEWINLGGAHGVTGVDETISHGVKLVKNQNGTVKASVTTGSVASGNDLVVTGGTTYTAIYNAKNQIHSYIDSLGGSKTAHGSYVDVGVTTSGGKVSGVTVIESNTLINALGKADSAIQMVRNLNDITGNNSNNGNYLNLSYQKDGSEIFIGLDKNLVLSYVTDNLSSSYTFNNSSYFEVNAEIKKGKLSYVEIEAKKTLIDALGKADYAYNTAYSAYNIANSAIQTVRNFDDSDVYVTYEKSGSELFIGLDTNRVFNYVTNNIWETYSV